MDTQGIISFCASFGLCAVLTPLVRRVAIRQGWLARPSDDRWHKNTTALMGGMAIFAAIIIPLVAISDFSSLWRIVTKGGGAMTLPSTGAVIAIGATVLFLLGVFDDFRNIKPQTKLVGQIVAASLVAFLGFRLHWFNSLTLDTMATLFWIVGITNAFNLIDNMDGLCAGVGMVAAISLASVLYPAGAEPFRIALIIAGAAAGFLIYNFNPAKIFMGDCGSLVIGFSIAVLTLSFSQTPSATRLAAIAVPILVLLVPILDTSLVTIIRLLSGRKASTGGRDHTSHRLVLIGFSEKSAVLFLYGVGGVSGLAALFVATSDNMTSPMVIIPVAVAIILMGVYLSQLRVYPEKEFSALRDRRFTPVLVELTYKRQLILVLLDFVIVAFAYYLSYRLRFEGAHFSHYFTLFFKSLPAIIGCKLLVFYAMGIYRGMWSYISTNDVFLYVRASLMASLLSVVLITFMYRFVDFSKGVFFIDWVLTSALLIGVRGSFRLFLETRNRKTLSGDKVIIYGAGRAGELLLREILHNKYLNVKPIGFIDDNPLKKGKRIQGYPILGPFAMINEIHSKHGLNGILISFNCAEEEFDRAHDAAKQFCARQGIFLRQFKIELQDMDLSIS
jgi:UDP-GlcNAc:undecaprenyl-phosphate/decaprenyl-phosphate GlcNAc-1-phosphate transferase